MFKSILVPVDIAEVEVAQPGVDEAVELAKAGGAVLRLVHVRSPVPYAMNEYIPAEYYDSDEKAALDGARKPRGQARSAEGPGHGFFPFRQRL